MRDLGTWRIESNLFHRDVELLSIFGFVDRLLCRPDHFDAVFLKNALCVEL